MGKFKRGTLIGFGCVFLVALYAAIPLFGKGYIPTHDGEYHILRFWQFSKMLSEGNLVPRWAPDFNSGYGVPIFNFHYPFPNYVGSLLHGAGASFVDAFKLTLAFGYLVACVAGFLWLLRLFTPFAATVSTAIFATIPYWFIDIYVRGSVGEVWAIAWFLGILAAIEHKKLFLISLFTALTIISHNIMAMILFPIILSYMWLRSPKSVSAWLLGVFLASYFWIPAIIERSYVTGLNIVNFKDHFVLLPQLLIPSWGTGFSVAEYTSDEMSYQIGVIPILIVIFGVFLMRGQEKFRHLSVLFLTIFALSIFFMLESSHVLWESVPILPFVQYPWRFLVVVMPVVLYFAALVAVSIPKWASVVFVVVSLVLTASYMRPVIYAPRDDTYYLSRPEFTDGTSSIGNTFTTIWTDWKQTRAEHKIEVVAGSGNIDIKRMKSQLYDVEVHAVSDVELTIHTLFYPGWRVFVDDREVAVDYRKNGLINISVPAGFHNLRIFFSETWLRIASNLISFLCLFWLIASSILKHNYARHYKHIAT